VNQTRPHCVNQMGKTHSKPLAARHAMCESALKQPSCEATTHHLVPRFRISRSVLHFTLRSGRTSLVPT